MPEVGVRSSSARTPVALPRSTSTPIAVCPLPDGSTLAVHAVLRSPSMASLGSADSAPVRLYGLYVDAASSASLTATSLATGLVCCGGFDGLAGLVTTGAGVACDGTAGVAFVGAGTLAAGGVLFEAG